jgi:predicted flavoprotein YhiN
VSGGGRCNVTHHCFENGELIKNYPRGEKELRQVFSQFSVQDTIDWFLKRGVKLKVEQMEGCFLKVIPAKLLLIVFIRSSKT